MYFGFATVCLFIHKISIFLSFLESLIFLSYISC